MLYKSKHSWEGEFEAENDEDAVIKQIRHNMNFWGSRMCKLDTLVVYCLHKGIKNVEPIIFKLGVEGKITSPKKGYIGLK
uniref:Uncharacterized protein n=1 Tax=viral metagenome TaxID=1070528 RepID=A0A6M3J3C6_9ZZZZ